MGDNNYDEQPQKAGKKMHNTLPIWGNEQTMNLNPLILANIQGSSYFKVHLFKLKTYHEVVDEIYYQVKHLEPWERGSRKTAGQTGMCGGVRGVGAGGIVSTAYCLLYKLYTLRLTRKQLNGLLTHTDSPYIRALGFMYIRYTQPPADLFDWYEEYLEDEEDVDPKAGGGQSYQMGQLVRQMMVKLDWFSTLFPRIPVPIQKQIEQRLAEHARQLTNSKPPCWSSTEAHSGSVARDRDRAREQPRQGDADRYSRDRNVRRDRDSDRERNTRDKVERRDRDVYKDSTRDNERDRDRNHHKEKERDRDRHRSDRDKDRRERPRSRSRERHRGRSRSKERRHR